MKNYQDSDYALNRHSEGIVYRFANEIIEVTLEDYLAENPGKTSADFRKLKALSDSNYREQDRSGYRQTWKNVPMGALDETEQCAAPSPEEIHIGGQEQAERRQLRLKTASRALGKLTVVQRRRYLLHIVKGLTLRQIAEIEGVNHSKIQNSIAEAEKKIKKVLQDA